MLISEDFITVTKCFHCGDDCPDESLKSSDKVFCCNGCKTVYEILNEKRLCNYYSLEEHPGISPKEIPAGRFDYLDDDQTIEKLTDFRNEKISSVTFFIPDMHCSSCIWLLENLYRLNSAIILSKVDFLKKTLHINYQHNVIPLKEVVSLLASIGYEPRINLNSLEKQKPRSIQNKLYAKLGVAAFSFGNIMLLSFPEYLSIDPTDIFYRKLFGYLNLILALPVLLYSSSDYFVSAFKGIRKKIVNLDVPISLGIIALFSRSAYEVLTLTGAGYFDSLAGLLFFLLSGKIFQNKTYDALNFERDYKSYFPLSVTVKTSTKEKTLPLSKLNKGDRILIRNGEIIPADAILITSEANIDYSFVTGESEPVHKESGDLIYAGGRQSGSIIELEVIREVSQSYLTRLWNNDAFNKPLQSNFTQFSNVLSKYFTMVILAIALISSIFWLNAGVSSAISVFTAVLIIACPCALAMSTPFTLGNTLRIFGKNKFYLKNTYSVENLSRINEIVFDKTGTITIAGKSDVAFIGEEALTENDLILLRSAVRNSTHPLSRIIHDSTGDGSFLPVQDFSEEKGLGISARIGDKLIKVGSKYFSDSSNGKEVEDNTSTRVYFSIEGKSKGYFNITNNYRKGLRETISKLSLKFRLSLLSGDNEGEKENLKKVFSGESVLLFNQSPQDKLDYIKQRQDQGSKVMMVGDGLNDAGALTQSDSGIAVADDTGNFTPACDGILDASNINRLPDFLNFARTSSRIIIISFIISFLYNVIGLSFAVSGMLTPLVAAILMPLSSITVVSFTTLTTNYIARRRGLLSL